jgi:hypothetical protein
MSNIQGPLVTKQIQDFLKRLKESIDLAFGKIIPTGNLDELVLHLDQKSNL